MKKMYRAFIILTSVLFIQGCDNLEDLQTKIAQLKQLNNSLQQAKRNLQKENDKLQQSMVTMQKEKFELKKENKVLKSQTDQKKANLATMFE